MLPSPLTLTLSFAILSVIILFPQTVSEFFSAETISHSSYIFDPFAHIESFCAPPSFKSYMRLAITVLSAGSCAYVTVSINCYLFFLIINSAANTIHISVINRGNLQLRGEIIIRLLKFKKLRTVAFRKAFYLLFESIL